MRGWPDMSIRRIWAYSCCGAIVGQHDRIDFNSYVARLPRRGATHGAYPHRRDFIGQISCIRAGKTLLAVSKLGNVL
jgi:hypothetical protein